MVKTTRWMTWVLDESATTDTAMPWARKRQGASAPTHETHDLVAKAPALTHLDLKSA